MNDEITQIDKIIAKSKNPLIVLAKNPSHDAIASSLGLHSFYTNLQKNVGIVSHNFTPAKNINFLKNIGLIQPNISNLQNYLISIDIPQEKIENIRHYHEGNNLNISLHLKEGNIKKENIRFGSGKFNHDIIIALDAENLEDLGPIYENNLDFFYHTPIINIDHKPGNTHFGQINLVDLTASSVSEILYNIYNKDAHLMQDEEISTYFLTGIISKTKSFKTENITPRVLNAAGRLISMGAKREEIVNNLYKQRTVPILKLWGRALAGLNHNDSIGLVWSVLSREDFIKAGADQKYLPEVIDELIINSPEARLVLLIYEQNDGQICCLLRAGRNFDMKKVAMQFNATAINNEIKFCINDKDLIESEKWIIDHVRNMVQK